MRWSYHTKNILRGWIILIMLLGPAGISLATAPIQHKTQTEWVAGGKKKATQQFFLTRSFPKNLLTNNRKHALSILNRSIQVRYNAWLKKELSITRCPLLLSRIIPQADEPNLSFIR